MCRVRFERLAVAALGAGVALMMAGCGGGPLMVRVEVPEPQSAALNVRLLEGQVAAQPPQCDTPCVIRIEPATVHRLTLRAPGYHTARVELTYD